MAFINRKQLFFLALLVLAYMVIFIIRYRRNDRQGRSDPGLKIEPEKFRQSPVIPDNRGQCKMECLGLTLNDISYVLENGLILRDLSEYNLKPCPGYAMEGRTASGRKITIFFRACTEVNNLIEIKTEEEKTCDCPSG